MHNKSRFLAKLLTYKKGMTRREFVKLLFYSIVFLGAMFSPLFGKAKKAKAGNKTDFKPSYLNLHKSGELKKRGEKLWNIMKACRICPRECGINRLEGKEGFCHASSQLEISSHHPHFGEEDELVGNGGSGTIFFTNCSLRCVFCINWDISQEGNGRLQTIDNLANMMIELQSRNCKNINVVTPTHYLPHIILALDKACAKGLQLPLVYNTCGWERLEILKILDGVVDIYLPDFKYSSPKMSSKYSSLAKDYPKLTKKSLLEMNRQVGIAKPSSDDIIKRGLMIRHLVMPNDVSGTKGVLMWIGTNLPKNTYVNLMSQYKPCYKAFDYPEIARRITRKEYQEAVQWAEEAGLTNVHLQGA